MMVERTPADVGLGQGAGPGVAEKGRPCMTVLRRTWLDGSCGVLDGRPQREAHSSRGALGD
jgi:hypothetical protein